MGIRFEPSSWRVVTGTCGAAQSSKVGVTTMAAASEVFFDKSLAMSLKRDDDLFPSEGGMGWKLHIAAYR